MPDPFRLRLLKNLTSVIEAVTPTGETESLEGKVFRGRILYGDSDPMPLVSILEAPAPLEQIESPEGSASNAGGWELVIQGWTKDDRQHPTDPAHVFMADVKKALIAERKKAMAVRGNNALGMGGKVTSITLSPGVVRPPDEVSNKAYFWLSVKIGLVEDLDDPYA